MEQKTESTRVAIYARISTSDGKQDVKNQLLELRRFAESQEWSIFQEYIDHKKSGKSADRPQFRQLFKDASQRRLDVVLVLVARQIHPRRCSADPFSTSIC